MSRIRERYIRSAQSSNLRDDDRHHNLDICAAMALSSEFGSLLHRAKYGEDRRARVQLYGIWRQAVAKKLKRPADDIADISVMHWLDDVCQTCHGRGHPVIIKTPTLEDATCRQCGGSGRKKLSCSPSITNYVRDCIQQLEQMVSAAASRSGELME